MDISKKTKEIIRILGIKKLRKHQLKPIRSILDGQDTMVIAPTSAGKSAIYQVTALQQSGVTLVIEPTISLMRDQVNRLVSRGIAAAALDSTMDQQTKTKVLNRLANGKIKLLFITPERLQNDTFRAVIDACKIGMIAVDECHCVTSWGYGFRADYLKIGEFIEYPRQRPIVVALTATAAPEERDTICKLLRMHKPNLFVQSLYRPNLRFMKRVFTSDEDKLRELKKLFKKHPSGSCIIYCTTNE